MPMLPSLHAPVDRYSSSLSAALAASPAVELGHRLAHGRRFAVEGPRRIPPARGDERAPRARPARQGERASRRRLSAAPSAAPRRAAPRRGAGAPRVPSGHAYSSAYTVSTFSLSSSRIIFCSARAIWSMPVSPCSARTIVPPVTCATRASCASPSADSSVVSGLPSSSRRMPVDLPVRTDLGDHLGRAAADLHDVDARPLALAVLRHARPDRPRGPRRR